MVKLMAFLSFCSAVDRAPVPSAWEVMGFITSTVAKNSQFSFTYHQQQKLIGSPWAHSFHNNRGMIHHTGLAHYD